MLESDPDVLAKIRRLQLLLACTFLFALVPWVVLGACAWKFSQPTFELSKTIVARGLELRDENGARLVRLTAEGQGGDIQLASSEGKAMVKLSAGGLAGDIVTSTRAGATFARLGPGTGKGAALKLQGPDGKQTVYLGSETDGSGNLTIGTKTGDLAVVLRTDGEHGGGVSLYRGQAHPIGVIGGDVNGGGALVLFNAKDQQYAQIATTNTHHGSLQIGSGDKARVLMSVSDAGTPYVQLDSPKSNGFLTLMCPNEGGEWKLGDSKGRLRAMGGWVKDGTEALKIFGPDENEAAVVCDQGTGGFFQTYARTGNVVFQAGCAADTGNGHVQVNHASGARAVWVGSSDNNEGGMIRIRDLKGNILLDAP